MTWPASWTGWQRRGRHASVARTRRPIAARQTEIVRIKGALQRAEELSGDLAAAIQKAL